MSICITCCQRLNHTQCIYDVFDTYTPYTQNVHNKKKKKLKLPFANEIGRVMLITYYEIRTMQDKKKEQRKNKRNKVDEIRKQREQLDSIVVCLTNASYTTIYKIWNNVCYNMKFNGRL